MNDKPKAKKPRIKKKRNRQCTNKSVSQWTDEQLEEMSKVTDKDLDDVRVWLKKTGQLEAIAMSYADSE